MDQRRYRGKCLNKAESGKKKLGKFIWLIRIQRPRLIGVVVMNQNIVELNQYLNLLIISEKNFIAEKFQGI